MSKFAAIFLLAALSAFSAEIIPASRRADWTANRVGVIGGIPDVSAMTVFRTFGSTATMAQVSSALQSCPSNQVVFLNAGTYNWTGDLDWQPIGSGKGLVGSTNSDGTPSTIIKSTASLVLIRGIACEACMGTEVNLSADGTQGDTNISVTTIPTWAAPGMLIGIDQLDDTTISTNPGQEAGTSYRQDAAAGSNGARGMGQLAKVFSTNGTTITLSTPLYWGWKTANTAQIWKPAHDESAGNGTIKRSFMENLVWEHTGTASSDNHMWKFENSEECWLRNVTGTNLASGAYVFASFSYRGSIVNCRFEQCKNDDSGQGYGVALYHVSTGWLVENNIFSGLHCAMQNNYGSCGNVFAYNAEFTGHSRSGQNPAFAGHGTSGFMVLCEGNWMQDKVLGDFTHGSGPYYTIFRNRVVGYNANNAATNNSSDLSAISVERYARKWNVVGNVAGLKGWHVIHSAANDSGFNATTNDCDSAKKVVYKWGFWADFGCDSPSDTFAESDPIWSVNFDTVTSTNSGIVLNGYATSDLTNSYYLQSKPTYFGALAWPPYGPDTVIHGTNDLSYTNIPAGYRFAFGTNPPAQFASGGSSGEPRRNSSMRFIKVRKP